MQITSPVKPLRATPTKNNLNKLTLDYDVGESFVKTVRVHLLMFLRQIEHANTEATVLCNESENFENDAENTPGNRYKLKEVKLNCR